MASIMDILAEEGEGGMKDVVMALRKLSLRCPSATFQITTKSIKFELRKNERIPSFRTIGLVLKKLAFMGYLEARNDANRSTRFHVNCAKFKELNL